MTLGSAWSVGLSGLSTSADQMSLVSRNVARAGNPDAARKVGEQITLLGGSARLSSVSRVADQALLTGVLKSSSSLSQDTNVMAYLDQVYGSFMDPSLDSSPAALLADLENQLRLYANQPSSRPAALEVVSSASILSGALNSATETLTTLRSDADKGIVSAVADMKTVLTELGRVNSEIVTADPARLDITDQLDKRDGLLKQLSEFVGIQVVPRNGNDIIVYADGGAVLFERTPREIEFSPTAYLSPGVSGGALTIDGVVVTGPDATMPLRNGSIMGLMAIRDEILPKLQDQVDEIARGLIEVFADEDMSGSGKPSLPGLFTWSGASVPASGLLVSGIAGSLRVNPQVDPAQGGDVRYLRDGGASAPTDPDYNANPGVYAGFSEKLLSVLEKFNTARPFDPLAGLSSQKTLSGFAAESVGWLQEHRQNTNYRVDLQTAIRERSVERLQGVTGISLDQEMADLLRFEQSYQAAGRLIATVDSMIKSIFDLGR